MYNFNVLRRAQVAKRLGVTIVTVVRLHGSLLHPTRDASGAYVYDSDEVKRAQLSFIKRGRGRAKGGPKVGELEGNKAADAFAMFEDNAQLRDVVKTLRVRPELVRKWHRAWKEGYEPDIESPDERNSRANDEAAYRPVATLPTINQSAHDTSLTEIFETLRGKKKETA